MALSIVPENISDALRGCTKETTSSFGDRPAVKVRLLQLNILSEDTAIKLKDMLASFEYSQWVDQATCEAVSDLEELGTEFFSNYRCEAILCI